MSERRCQLFIYVKIHAFLLTPYRKCENHLLDILPKKKDERSRILIRIDFRLGYNAVSAGALFQNKPPTHQPHGVRFVLISIWGYVVSEKLPTHQPR